MSLILNMHLLAQRRAERDALQTNVRAADAKLKETPEYLALEVARAQLAAKIVEVSDSEDYVRRFATNLFEDCGEKHPVPGVTVKVFSSLKYDLDQALAWCKSNATAFVREVLDTKSFEKVAKDLPGAPIETTEVARIYIDADLSGYLPPETAVTEGDDDVQR